MSLTKNAAEVDGAFSKIPIIDLSKCGTPEGRLTTAHEIRDACMQTGFFCVKNHGIPRSCLDNVLDAAKTYFSLPMETKIMMKVHHETINNLRGYNAPLQSTMDPANKDDGLFYEAFIIGWEGVEGIKHERKTEKDGVRMGPNVWPSGDCPGFREASLNYYHAGMKVGEMLYKLFSLALELPETFFDDKTANTTPMLRIMHYPSQGSDRHLEIDNHDTPGVGAHTDFECFTILWQQPGIQSLQVMNSEKKWVDVPAIGDTLVINVGDELEMWTNDIFKSTVHQAVNKSGKERYSFPLFFGVDNHVKIEPIPSCVSADRPAKYSPITAGEYVNKRIRDVYPTA